MRTAHLNTELTGSIPRGHYLVTWLCLKLCVLFHRTPGLPPGLEAVKVPEDLKFKQQDEHNNQVLLRTEEQVGKSRQE